MLSDQDLPTSTAARRRRPKHVATTRYWRLGQLLAKRPDLREVCPSAEYVEEAIRWSA